MFEKSPHMTPLLVRLHDTHKIYSLVKDDQPLAKAELTSAVADLLETDLNPKEQELLADVLIGLMRQAELDLRQALAEKLAVMDCVPLRLALFLVNDEISVARPVLRKSTVLSDLDLVYIIKAQGPAYWQAIADRERLSDQLIDILADTGDKGTAIALSRNERITLTNYALKALGEIARHHDDVAGPLLQRKDVPSSFARSLYEHVGSALQEYIRDHFGGAPQELKTAIDDTVGDILLDFEDRPSETTAADVKKAPKAAAASAANNKLSAFMPSASMLKLAAKYEGLGMINTQMAMELLERGRIPQFIAVFARYTEIPPRKLHDSLRQMEPRSLAIACRAMGVQKSDFARIYLMTNQMRSAGRQLSHRHMLNLLEYFDRVRPEIARKIIAQSRNKQNS